MTEDILERAKALRSSAFGTHKQALDVVDELIADIERLRSLNESLMENGNDLRTRCQKAEARIKELEADRIAYRNLGSRIEDLETYIERLEAAFLDHLAARLYYEHYPGESDAYSWHDYPEDACHSMPKEEFRKKARDALEEIKTGGKDE